MSKLEMILAELQEATEATLESMKEYNETLDKMINIDNKE